MVAATLGVQAITHGRSQDEGTPHINSHSVETHHYQMVRYALLAMMRDLVNGHAARSHHW